MGRSCDGLQSLALDDGEQPQGGTARPLYAAFPVRHQIARDVEIGREHRLRHTRDAAGWGGGGWRRSAAARLTWRYAQLIMLSTRPGAGVLRALLPPRPCLGLQSWNMSMLKHSIRPLGEMLAWPVGSPSC